MIHSARPDRQAHRPTFTASVVLDLSRPTPDEAARADALRILWPGTVVQVMVGNRDPRDMLRPAHLLVEAAHEARLVVDFAGTVEATTEWVGWARGVIAWQESQR